MLPSGQTMNEREREIERNGNEENRGNRVRVFGCCAIELRANPDLYNELCNRRELATRSTGFLCSSTLALSLIALYDRARR